MVCERVPVNLIAMVAAMVPAPGESPGDWWTNTGYLQAKRELDESRGRPADAGFDIMDVFVHDVAPGVVAAAFEHGDRRQSETPFAKPWPLDAWPEVPTEFLLCRDDRFFPVVPMPGRRHAAGAPTAPDAPPPPVHPIVAAAVHGRRAAPHAHRRRTIGRSPLTSQIRYRRSVGTGAEHGEAVLMLGQDDGDFAVSRAGCSAR
jgi:hypothetical protein